MTNIIDKLKAEVSPDLINMLTSHNQNTEAHADIRELINSKIDNNNASSVFEAMLDQAIYDEGHTTVTIHIDGDFMEEFGHKLYFDYEGTNAETGKPIGTLITPNNDGDYVINGVTYGQHIIFPPLDNNDGDFHFYDDEGATITVTKDKNEFTATYIAEPQE